MGVEEIMTQLVMMVGKEAFYPNPQNIIHNDVTRQRLARLSCRIVWHLRTINSTRHSNWSMRKASSKSVLQPSLWILFKYVCFISVVHFMGQVWLTCQELHWYLSVQVAESAYIQYLVKYITIMSGTPSPLSYIVPRSTVLHHGDWEGIAYDLPVIGCRVAGCEEKEANLWGRRTHLICQCRHHFQRSSLVYCTKIKCQDQIWQYQVCQNSISARQKSAVLPQLTSEGKWWYHHYDWEGEWRLAREIQNIMKGE